MFLAEVGFDNRDMLRTHDYCLRGESLIYRGEFNRQPRVSLLCFIGIEGLLETFHTEGEHSTEQSSSTAVVNLHRRAEWSRHTQGCTLCGLWTEPVYIVILALLDTYDVSGS